MNLFDPVYPTIRLVWDATTLASFARCPLQYYWRYVQGLVPSGTSEAIAFGTACHVALATWHECRDVGKAYEAGARHLDAEAQTAYSRAALFRAIVWYAETYRSDLVIRKHEHKFMLPLEIRSPSGEPYWIAGSFDALGESRDGAIWVVERKTMKRETVWDKYLPSTQLYTYAWAARRMFDRFGGIVVEAIQTGATFTRVNVLEYQAMSLPDDISFAVRRIKHAERVALDDAWLDEVNFDDPYMSRDVATILRAPKHLWHDMAQALFVKQPVWDPRQ